MNEAPAKERVKNFIARNVKFAEKCTETMGNRKTDTEFPSSLGKEYIFDPISCKYSVDGICYPMPSYIRSKSGSMMRINKRGAYPEQIFSSYSSFVPRISSISGNVISQSISDVCHHIPSDEIDRIGLMPDSVDDFTRDIRSQMVLNGSRLFNIPRSIALCYGVQSLDINADFSPKFLCVDYDGEETAAVEIHIETGDDGKPVFVRYGLRDLKSNYHNFSTLANKYIMEYEAKYDLKLTEKMKKDLIESKLLVSLLWNTDDEPLILSDGGMVVSIWRDDKISADIQKAILSDTNDIANYLHMPAYALSLLAPPTNDGICSMDTLVYGCSKIRERFHKGEILWEEFLPELTLGVCKDGRFADVELITKENRKQGINASFMGQTVTFPVNVGSFYLPCGRERYSLPLERKLFGKLAKDKNAEFEISPAFEENMPASLQVNYTYGDVDSYVLVANCDDGTVLKSTWVNRQMGNPAPNFEQNVIEFSNNQRAAIYMALRNFSTKIKGRCFAGLRGQGESVDSYLLKDVNAGYWPYFNVRKCFSSDSEWNMAQILQIGNDGIFDTVAEVIRGNLPSESAKLNVICAQDTLNMIGDPLAVLSKNMSDLASQFGQAYNIPESENQAYEGVRNMISAFEEEQIFKNPNTFRYFASMTACVKRDNDTYGVWDKFSSQLKKVNENNPRSALYAIRSLSGLCYISPEWIFEFYKGKDSNKEVQKLLKCVDTVLKNAEWDNATMSKPYNMKKVRDVLEFLLAICCLKKVDQSLLECNAPETKELVRKLKTADAGLRKAKMEERATTKQYDDTRISNLKDLRGEDFYNVNPVIYALIETLTGQESINLVGFVED